MKDPYTSTHYESLDKAIKQISLEFRQKIFDEKISIEKSDWITKSHTTECAWLFSFEKIRDKVFAKANIEKKHVNEDEAKKLLTRLNRKQEQLKEQAIKEELESKQKEQVLIDYMEPHSQRMNQMKNELQNPQNFMPLEKFCDLTKFAVLLCNEDYDQMYTTMDSLPAVKDDLKVARQTVKMMGILPENTKEMYNAQYDEIHNYFAWLSDRICAFTRPLDDFTGIIGLEGYVQGIKWSILKTHAMKLVAPFDSVVITLNEKDEQKLKDLIKFQKDADKNNRKMPATKNI